MFKVYEPFPPIFPFVLSLLWCFVLRDVIDACPHLIFLQMIEFTGHLNLNPALVSCFLSPRIIIIELHCVEHIVGYLLIKFRFCFQIQLVLIVNLKRSIYFVWFLITIRFKPGSHLPIFLLLMFMHQRLIFYFNGYLLLYSKVYKLLNCILFHIAVDYN